MKMKFENILYKKNDYGWQFKEDLSFYKSKILGFDLMDSKNGKILITKGTKVNQKIINDIIPQEISAFFFKNMLYDFSTLLIDFSRLFKLTTLDIFYKLNIDFYYIINKINLNKN